MIALYLWRLTVALVLQTPKCTQCGSPAQTQVQILLQTSHGITCADLVSNAAINSSKSISPSPLVSICCKISITSGLFSPSFTTCASSDLSIFPSPFKSIALNNCQNTALFWAIFLSKHLVHNTFDISVVIETSFTQSFAHLISCETPVTVLVECKECIFKAFDLTIFTQYTWNHLPSCPLQFIVTTEGVEIFKHVLKINRQSVRSLLGHPLVI